MSCVSTLKLRNNLGVAESGIIRSTGNHFGHLRDLSEFCSGSEVEGRLSMVVPWGYEDDQQLDDIRDCNGTAIERREDAVTAHLWRVLA
jgi:hypothetical protein